ncbi:MAG: PH domain-containing protein [Chloroflexota bacterium]
MAYVDGLLADGERVVRRERQHWFVMVWNARWAIGAVVLAIIGGIIRLLNGGDSILMTILGWVVLALLLIGIVSLIWGWFVYQSTEYVITNRRIVQVSGVVNKRASDSSLEKINDAILTESIFGRMFGFGDLEVLTASESGIELLRMLTDAKTFKKAMLDAKHELEVDLVRPTMPPMRAETPYVPPAPAAPALDPRDRHARRGRRSGRAPWPAPRPGPHHPGGVRGEEAGVAGPALIDVLRPEPGLCAHHPRVLPARRVPGPRAVPCDCRVAPGR